MMGSYSRLDPLLRPPPSRTPKAGNPQARTKEKTMTIAIGDKLPAATFKEKTADGPVEITTDQLFA